MATEEPGVDRIDPSEATSPVDIWKQYPGISDSKLFHEFVSRLTAGRDMHVIITAASETGVGKTTLAFCLALLWDMSGWTADKATLDPREYEVMYDEVQPGSVLLLDEAERAVDARRGSSKDNVKLSQAFASKRYRQVFGMMTAPSKGWVDGRLGEDSADYWIQAQETDTGKPKGEAKVYRLKNNEHYESSYTQRTETISWPILDWHPEFKALDRKKRERLEGDTKSSYVHREEYERLKENYWNKSMQKTRFGMVRAMYDHGLSQGDIASILTAADHVDGLSQQRVSNLVNADSFEDVYSG